MATNDCQTFMCHSKYGRLTRDGESWIRLLASNDVKAKEKFLSCQGAGEFCESEEKLGNQRDISQYLAPIEQLSHNIQNGTIVIQACQLGQPGLKITKVWSSKEKTSASPSLIAFGTIAEKEEVVIKITFEYTEDAPENSMDIERKVYEYLVPKMLQFTPHLTQINKVIFCDSWLETLNEFQDDKIGQQLELATNRLTTSARNLGVLEADKCYFLITQKAGTKTLREAIKHYIPIDSEFLPQVLFQLAYTLLVFEKFGFRHNDLHTNNVFIDELDDPISIHYKIGQKGQIYQLVTKYLVRIYDFDHSTKSPSKFTETELTNTLLTTQFCRKSGECNDFLKSWDWFTIVTATYLLIYHISVKDPGFNPKILKSLYEIVPQERLKKQLQATTEEPHTGRAVAGQFACDCLDEDCDECQVAKEVLNQTLSVEEYLVKYGQPYQVNHSSIQPGQRVYHLP